MPIRPELKSLYPPDWKQISQRIRFERARGRCEFCEAPHGYFRVGSWLVDPALLERIDLSSFEDLSNLRVKISRIVLTTAHLDQDPTNNDESNLAALCQRCHLRHDLTQHLRNRRINRELAAGQGRLFAR